MTGEVQVCFDESVFALVMEGGVLVLMLLGVDGYLGWLTSALISAVQQIAKGKMFSSAIIIAMVLDLTCFPAETNLFILCTAYGSKLGAESARAQNLEAATLAEPDMSRSSNLSSCKNCMESQSA